MIDIGQLDPAGKSISIGLSIFALSSGWAGLVARRVDAPGCRRLSPKNWVATPLGNNSAGRVRRRVGSVGGLRCSKSLGESASTSSPLFQALCLTVVVVV